MSKYCVTAARPKNAAHHLNSEFKLWKREKDDDGDWKWVLQGWKRTVAIAALLDAKNETKFKISDMPDK